MVLLKLLTADLHSNASAEEHIRQNALMKVFFADVTPEGREDLSKFIPDDSENYLRWGGVTRTQGRVLQVYYHHKSICNFNIHALPHSTKYINIVYCMQKYAIQTRMLPNQLLTMDMHGNDLFGTVDLTNLPDSLETMVLYSNKICGPIDITSLPRTLITLSLDSNRIDQKVVLYGILPPKIESIELSSQRNVEFGIQGIRAMSEEHKLSKAKAARIFGMRHFEALK